MTERDFAADEHFERTLLAAARGDSVAVDVDAAWSRFERTACAVAASAAGGHVVPAGGSGAGVEVAEATVASAWRAHATKWALLGALGGGAITAAGFLAFPRVHESAAVSSPATVPSVVDTDFTSPDGPSAPSPRNMARNVAAPLLGDARPTRSQPRTRAKRSAIPAAATATPSSATNTLAAQVALLDRARAALAGGASNETLRLVARYRTEFPVGELLPDAEVVGIEALSALDDQPRLQERAAAFLDKHPNDPHAAKVRALAAR